MYEIEFYQEANGDTPIRILLEDLQAKGKTSKHDRVRSEKILTYIRALEELGPRLCEPFTKHLTDDIWELRPFNDRILFFYFKDNIYVLLHHFVKKTNKTPIKEIERAKKNKLTYIERSL